ncbi:zinc finger protein with KRAB and SCAN domains 7-like isoform X2 [Erythrolamprus reginae]|uniref:zinc finger protein with KRAB and SCAN domains 7-like isoform X2 n=1 Tax=Erythrolamprus reginae TaxID=121349 RepID=UPI00396C472A
MEKSLEGSGKVPRIVQVMYFKGGPRQLNQPPEVALPQQWEAQWQEFLNTLQPAQTAPWNDVGAFLLAFEQVAEVCQWPREEWVRQLLPAFRAGMEQSLYRLDPRDRSDYAKVKAAILRADALRVEMKRQHFRQCCYQELEGPRRVYSQLQDLCRQWLKPESHTKEQILELIIQEHLLGILPTEAQNWVRECGPKDCVEMVALAEEFLIGHRHAPWQVPLPEASVSSLESEGRQRQHYHHPGASEMTPTRNSALAQPSSAGLQMAATGTAEEPVRVKEELEETPLHWEVMRRSGGSASALEGLLVPTPELDPQTDQPQGAFQERPEHGDQIPSAQFGKRIAGEIKVENFDQASSETEDDFEPLQEEESLDPEFSQLDPQKLLSSRQQKGKTPKKRCLRRRRRACKKKNKYYPSEKRHTCPECGHKCYFYSDLLRHMKRHVEKQRFVCLECGKTYRGQACFKNHQRTHLPPGDNGRRKKAGAKNTGYQTKKEYICFKCGVVKRSQSGLAEHMKVHTDEKTYQCTECGKMFRWQSNLCRHRRLHTNGRSSSRQLRRRGKEAPRDTCPPQQNIKLEGETGEYPICGDQLIPTVSQEEGQTANEASEHQNMKMHSCRKCGYQAEKLGDILKHFRIHNKEKPYRYLDCGNSFGWSSNLMRNQQTLDQQTPMPNVVVAECDVTLSDDEELINFLGKKKPPRHEAGLQNGPKKSSKRSPAAAPPRSAANRLKASPSLRSREWNGKGKSAGPANNVKKSRYEGLEKKHLCLDCGQRTYYLSDLIRHKSAHPNGKPYQCPDCEKIFVHPSFLKIHLKTHKAQKKPMKSLKKTQGERKYTCSKCGHKTYKLSTHLLHMRAHVGESEKSFTCEECGKCFKRNVNLARHKLVHKRSSESVKVRRPSYTMDKEINRGYEEPKKTAEVHVKKIGRRSAAASAASTALREHWHQYKYQQRKKAAEECQKTEESVKENIEVKVEKVVEEPKEEEKHTPELSLRARLERFAYSKNKGNKAVRQEEPAPDPKDSQEEPAPDPKDSQGESAPDPMDSQGESAPDPKDSGEEPAPDPKDSQGESAPDPMDSQGESAPDPKDSGEEPAPDPKDSQGESAPDPMDSREEPALDPMDSRKEPEPDPMDSQEKPELDPKDSQGESAPDPMDSREEPAPDPMDSREEPEPDPKDSQGESAPDPMDSREEPAPDPIDSREEPVLDPKVSAEDLHQECTVCGKTFTHDRQLTDHQNLDAEAKPDRCNECQK